MELAMTLTILFMLTILMGYLMSKPWESTKDLLEVQEKIKSEREEPM